MLNKLDKIFEIVQRNKKCLDGTDAIRNRVNLEWWKQSVNIGDTLAPVIYAWMLKQKNIAPDMRINKTIHLTTVGSLIGQGRFDATIWGSGILDVINIRHMVRDFRFRKFDVRAVRGPVSRFVLECTNYKCPPIYGDPAILMPLIYNNNANCEKCYNVSIIKHRTRLKDEIGQCHEISVETNNYQLFIDEILKSRKIISSSLHGIILAESYGIPSVFLCAGMEQEILKFYDWYLSTERQQIRFAGTLEEAMSMEPMELPSNLNELRNGLLNAFPYDLWA